MPQRLRITSLSYGPHGIGRLDGKVIFTRSVAPGEDVDVEIQEDRGSFAYADLQRVVTPSSARRQPPCPYLPRCGGCPWQHLDDATQRQSKWQNVVDHLERIGRLKDVVVAPIIASPADLGYRGRLTLRTDGKQVGFYAAASHDLVPVSACLLATDSLNAAIAPALDLVRRLRSAVRRIEIASGTDEAGVVLVGEVEGPFVAADARLLESWLQPGGYIRAVVLHGRRWRHTWGDDLLTIRPLADEPLRVHAGAFTQVNPLANQRLVETVLALAAIDTNQRGLDVYAGVGNFSIPMARRAAHVVAIEQNGLAAADARHNAQHAGLANLDVITAAARPALLELVQRGERYDVAVLDPPRSGAAEIIDSLQALRPRRLIYVSCNPATLARDLRALSTRYRVEEVQPIDLFPQTYHVETVVRAVLTC